MISVTLQPFSAGQELAALLGDRAATVLAALPPAVCAGALITLPHASPAPGADGVHARLTSDTLPWPAAPLDVVVVADALWSLEPLALLNQAFDRLADGARLVVLGEFSVRRTRLEYEPLPLVSHFVAQAERAGFKLVEPQALSPAGEVERARFLLVFERSAAPRWRLHTLRPEDAPAMRRLFEAAFGHPMSQALWEWKYGDGRGHAVWCAADGDMVGHLGLMRRTAIWQGEQIAISQYGDAMIRADQRGEMHGPYFLMVSTLTELQIGRGSGCVMGFAFVFERQMRKIEYLKLGRRIDHMVQYEWPSQQRRAFASWATRPLVLPTDAACLDRLWTAMQADLRNVLVGMRDAAYWRQRYVDHPAIRYELHLVYHRWTRRPLAALALKFEQERAVLVDWVAPLRATPAIIEAGRDLAQRSGKATLHTWITAGQSAALQVASPTVHDLDVLIHYATWTPTPDADAMHGRWWLTMGDTDYL